MRQLELQFKLLFRFMFGIFFNFMVVKRQQVHEEVRNIALTKKTVCLLLSYTIGMAFSNGFTLFVVKGLTFHKMLVTIIYRSFYS